MLWFTQLHTGDPELRGDYSHRVREAIVYLIKRPKKATGGKTSDNLESFDLVLLGTRHASEEALSANTET